MKSMKLQFFAFSANFAGNVFVFSEKAKDFSSRRSLRNFASVNNS